MGQNGFEAIKAIKRLGWVKLSWDGPEWVKNGFEALKEWVKMG